MNYRLLIQYDGTDFHGWQIQAGQRTVQGELTRVLSLLEGTGVNLIGSGRTDAGVHAEGQVANVHLQREITPEKLRNAINGNLERDVRVLSVAAAAEDFHARYSARGKTYRYQVVLGPVMSPFWSRYADQEARPLDFDLIRECSADFVGEHDWTAFSAAQADTGSRVRNVTELEVALNWDRRGQCELLSLTITANGFLRYMVRSIVGTLLALGRHEIDRESVLRAIQSGDRRLAGATAPAHGLTLLRVQYD
jgi:tRNA pseudouridine38-40 synthase